MNSIVKLNIYQFSLIYLLLIIVLVIMKKCKVNQSKLLLVASLRMSVQLVIAGLVLSYIFEKPHPLFTIAYIFAMVLFAVIRIYNQNKWLNKRFKIIVFISIALSGIGVIIYFIGAVVNVSIFNPQYAIPIGGMVIGNAMTGVSLALKTFKNSTSTGKSQIETLLNLGVTPQRILEPYVNNSLETALLPTLNSMISMGIISLPGMMTGQILSGTLPLTAIMYQIAIMIAICTASCLSVFCSLYFGHKTLINKRSQITFWY